LTHDENSAGNLWTVCLTWSTKGDYGTARGEWNRSEVATTAKLVSSRSRPLDPQVKGWIDNVIVPTLVSEYLASENKYRNSILPDEPMVQCPDRKVSPKGGK
jgi:hypothetical protein